MRVFVAGATGAVGSRLVPLLVSGGHAVTGMTRTPAMTDAIRRSGAEAVVADALDAPALRRALIDAGPEVVIHEMTALREANDPRHFDRAFVASNRLRTEGLDNLLAAAKEAGTRRILVQSYCGWPYARVGSRVKSEEDPLDPDPPRELRRSLEAIRHLERVVTSEPGIQGLVLRYGSFYGPRTGLFDGPTIDAIRRRRFPMVGNGNGWWSFLQIDDAAAATALAVDRGAPGIYNIVDDEPAPVRTWLPVLAGMLGARPPWGVPKWLARLTAGEHIVQMMTEIRAGSNTKARRDLAWLPAFPSWRQGFAEALKRDA